MKNNKKISILVFCLLIIITIIMLIVLNKDKLLSNNELTKKSQNKTKIASIKIDETRPIVYGANYTEEKQVKFAKSMEGIEWNTINSLKYPYINVKSEYVNTINKELKKDFENTYLEFGGEYTENNPAFVSIVSYEYYTSGDILSVIIKKKEGYTNSGSENTYLIYNINIKTGKKATIEEVYTECGYKDEFELLKNVEATIKKQIFSENVSPDAEWNISTDLYYMDYNKNFNVIVMGNVSLIDIVITRVLSESDWNF